MTIKEVLMKRDGMSSEEADSLIEEAREEAMNRLAEGEEPWDICEEYFGLEPDYLEDLLGADVLWKAFNSKLEDLIF